MAFLARCPDCGRAQRVDSLEDVDLIDAGDVFVRCNASSRARARARS